MFDYPFGRLELLVGSNCLNALSGARVALFGVGGVGSWCAEGLARSGIGKLMIVDSDVVNPSNINRQLPATSTTVGRPKVEVLGERLREINPDAEITVLQRVYSWEVRDEFDLGGYDYVIDAIDSLSSKVELIINAHTAGATLFSALGAACKVDATRVRVSSIWKSDRCKLGRFVRKKLRKRGFEGDFLCVWSDEWTFINDDHVNTDDDSVNTDYDDNVVDGVDTDDNGINNDRINTSDDNANTAISSPTNRTVNGSLVCVTGVFGFVLSGLVINDIINKTKLINNTK
jgi:tRNA threonylcarbamoyladenosine dehydratase